MRGATECAKRLKLLLSSLRSQLGKVSPPSPGDAITQMLMGILTRNVPEPKAADALDRLRSVVVDYNELRVIPPYEMSEALGDYPDARTKCEDITRSLNSIFAREHQITLDHLRSMSKRDALAYLEATEGLDDYTIARVRQMGLEQHAIPLDEAMWAYAREQEIVNPRCTLKEAQQFLERQVPDAEGLEVTALLCQQAWSDFGTAVRKGAVDRILSVPPDRTSRNMLQTVSSASPATVVIEDDGPDAADAAPTAEPAAAVAESKPDGAPAKRKRKSATTARASKATEKPKAAKTPKRKAKKSTATASASKTKTKSKAKPKSAGKKKTAASTKKTARKRTKSTRPRTKRSTSA